MLKSLKIQPEEYKNILPGYIFSPHNSRQLFIKHSEALAFDEKGNEAIFFPWEPVWPKRAPLETFYRMRGYINEHNKLLFETARKNEAKEAA